MKKLNLFFALVLGLFIISCGNNEKAGEDQDAATEEHDHAAATETGEHDHAATEETKEVAAELPQKDASGKWVANPETTAGIYAMSEMLKYGKDIPKGKDGQRMYQKMSTKLQEEMDGIFNKCTMTGESHEELHTFLLPMVDMIKTMGEKGEADCIKAMSDLTAHLKTYDSIFAG